MDTGVTVSCPMLNRVVILGTDVCLGCAFTGASQCNSWLLVCSY